MPDAPFASQQNRTIINATQEDQLVINRFLTQNYLIHRHLDWFSPLDWIGKQPFLVEKIGQQIQSIMLVAPEVTKATWVRLFCTKDTQSIESIWERMLGKCIDMILSMGIVKMDALGSSDWFTALLTHSSFVHINDVVVLDIKGAMTPLIKTHPEIDVRPMQPDDLPIVHEIDQVAFEPLWQNALASLTKAFHQQGISTVALVNGKNVGYQISTCLGIHGHLARLAVHPEHQGKQVASALLSDLLNRFRMENISHVTVNTQADNWPSLAVYQKFGFHKTKERIPVYQRDL